MSKQQQLELIATLRQGQLDLGADVATLRVAFNDVMARIPVASDVDHVPTTIGGVNAVDVTIRASTPLI
jgi:epsilon-lactone hydrolase